VASTALAIFLIAADMWGRRANVGTAAPGCPAERSSAIFVAPASCRLSRGHLALAAAGRDAPHDSHRDGGAKLTRGLPLHEFLPSVCKDCGYHRSTPRSEVSAVGSAPQGVVLMCSSPQIISATIFQSRRKRESRGHREIMWGQQRVFMWGQPPSAVRRSEAPLPYPRHGIEFRSE